MDDSVEKSKPRVCFKSVWQMRRICWEEGRGFGIGACWQLMELVTESREESARFLSHHRTIQPFKHHLSGKFKGSQEGEKEEGIG
ncbi:hypothetical protein Nepgr_015202 [Nepenthes gracilis]|uniref:Uncharacterized protein n=1 Tax=Nepenthes gracilis TaxID=150966 RepID=A0AAD3SN73_NEPGR|nr:hypothetical protein Nepgr_015202 [Nepenthes gracilis]